MATMKVKSTLDSKNYKRGVDEMKKKTSKFGKGLKSIKGKMAAAFAVGAIIAVVRGLGRAAKSLVDYGSKLSDLSAQTGVAIDTLNKLNDAALNAGSSQEKMAKALVSLRDAQGEVLDGDKLMTDAFENLGITIDDVATSDLETLFVKVSKSLTESGNSGKELSAVFDILGKRNAMELTEAMNEVAGGIDNVEQKTKSLTDTSAQRLDVIADVWERKKKSIQASAAGILAGLFGGNDEINAEVAKRQRTTANMREIEAASRALDLAELKAEAEKKRLATVEKVAIKEETIARKRAQDIESIREGVKIEIDTNSIRRIGGKAGSAVNESLKMARKQAETLSQIEDYNSSLPTIEKNTRTRGLA